MACTTTPVARYSMAGRMVRATVCARLTLLLFCPPHSVLRDLAPLCPTTHGQRSSRLACGRVGVGIPSRGEAVCRLLQRSTATLRKLPAASPPVPASGRSQHYSDLEVRAGVQGPTRCPHQRRRLRTVSHPATQTGRFSLCACVRHQPLAKNESAARHRLANVRTSSEYLRRISPLKPLLSRRCDVGRTGADPGREGLRLLVRLLW